MPKEIDNFQTVCDNLLKFDKAGEFYMVLVLRRRKDVKGKVVEGVYEDNRLIKHYFVYDREYLGRKKDAIIALCKQNNARAYILPQRRSHDIVMWALHNKTGEVLKSGSKNTHFDHLIRSCVAGMHEVPPDAKWHKRWVIDIDGDDEDIQAIAVDKFFPSPDSMVEVYAEWLADMLTLAIVDNPEYKSEATDKFMPSTSGSYKNNDIVVLPTPHGFHIVTPPFNRDTKALKDYFGDAYPRADWIKPDAMALLYAPATIN